MGLFGTISAIRSGLSAQRIRMDVVAANVANLETTRTPEGGPYRRRVVLFASADQVPFADLVRRFTGSPERGVVLTQVTEDTTSPFRRVRAPEHPDADAEGYVELPNVDLVTEMTDLVSANRSYQANATVLQAVKQMALAALDLARR